MRATLLAAAFVDRTRMSGPAGRDTWNPDGADVPPDGRVFFPDWPRFSRADRPSRFVLAASTLLPADLPGDPSRIAVVLGSRTGCLDADRTFAASRADRPLPSVYSRTLPSTPGAELAILRGLRGPNFAIVQDAAPGLRAVAAAISELSSRNCAAAIAGEFDAVAGEPGSGWACLLLLGRPDLSGPATIRVVRTPTDACDAVPPRSPLMDLVGFLYDPAAPTAIDVKACGAGSRLVLSVARERGTP
jgi:hypothetical protein